MAWVQAKRKPTKSKPTETPVYPVGHSLHVKKEEKQITSIEKKNQEELAQIVVKKCHQPSRQTTSRKAGNKGRGKYPSFGL